MVLCTVVLLFQQKPIALSNQLMGVDRMSTLGTASFLRILTHQLASTHHLSLHSVEKRKLWPWTADGLGYFLRAHKLFLLLGLVVIGVLWSAPAWADEIPAPFLSAGGYHTCALEVDGSVDCWGSDRLGQAVDQDGPYIQIETGVEHSCGLRADGRVDCWGDNGLNQSTGHTGPFTQIAVGANFNCGLAADGSVTCWGGDNDWGEVTDQSGPFTQITAGTNHNCGIAPDGAIFCWGTNKYSQTDAPSGLFTQLSAGWDHTCGLGVDGRITCWGRNLYGQLDAPDGLFVLVSAGDFHTCGLKPDGSVLCWGLNNAGQLDAPDSHFRSISAGGLHTCGLRFFGSVDCWGDDLMGQNADQAGPYGQLIAPPVGVTDRYHTGRNQPLEIGLPGVLVNDINATGGPQLAYLGADQSVQLLTWFGDRWHHFDLTDALDAPVASGDSLIATTVGGDPRIYYLAADGHIHELAWTGAGAERAWVHRDLTSDTGGSLAAAGSALSTTVVNGAPRVYYLDDDQHVQELAWVVDAWSHRDVTLAAGATPADAGSALGATTAANGDPRVYYVAGSHNIYELAWEGEQWVHWNLTIENLGWPATVAGSPLSVTSAGLDPRVYYLAAGEDGLHVHELAWFDFAWHHNDVTVAAGGLPASAGSSLSSMTISANGDPRVYYLAADQHVHELAWFSDAWHHSDVTDAAGGAGALSGTALATTTARHDPRVYYLDENHHIQELAWVGSSWASRDMTAGTLGATPARDGGLLTATTSAVDPQRAVLVEDVAHGVLTLDGNGSFFYTPEEGFEGVDGFVYQTTNGWEPSEETAAQITVAPPALALDVNVSLYNRPSTAAEREPYEQIMGYFADGLYESSNGARKLGKVTFYTDGTTGPAPDIIWVSDCHPSAYIAGYGVDFLHINMCDTFGAMDYNFLVDDRHQRGGGYVLAHEWGHYYFGLFDEYRLADDDEPVPYSIMNNQWLAVDESVTGDYKWLNFSVAKHFTTKTRQARVYGVSGWETLARPATDDPRSAWWSNRPLRTAFRDLQDVAPLPEQDASFELLGTARSDLEIVWVTEDARPATTTTATASEFSTHLVSQGGNVISYPEPIVLETWIGHELPMTGVAVRAIARLPDHSTTDVHFADDGQPPDSVAGDGLYSAILPYRADGIYMIDVTFDNDAARAAMVGTAFEPASGPDGEYVPIPAPVPVLDPFLGYAAIEIVVTNFAADDHGNGPEDARLIAANNERHTGQIDTAGDQDYFRFTTALSGTTYVRVTGLALGMDPVLRIFGPDGSELLFTAQLARRFPYVYIPLTAVPAGSTVFAQVSHSDGEATGGLYELSAGARLASDHLDPLHAYLPLLRTR